MGSDLSHVSESIAVVGQNQKPGFPGFLARFWSESGSEFRWRPMFTGNIAKNMSRLFFVLVSFFTLRMSETSVFATKMINCYSQNVTS